jgi:hypothetical protein
MIGPLTLAAVNAADPTASLARFRAQRVAVYREIVAAHPSDRQFMGDWMRRAEA